MINPEQHVIYKLMNVEMREFPFSHFYINDIFPKEYYQELLQHLPPADAYVPINSTGKVPAGTYPERGLFFFEPEFLAKLCPESQTFWKTLAGWMGGDSFFTWIAAKFDYLLEERDLQHVQRKLELVRDLCNYRIGPHPDTKSKVLTLIFYLPSDATHPHWGTSIYVPKHPFFEAHEDYHFACDGFKEAYRMPFLPNSLFGFFRTNTSFHGVECIHEVDCERVTLTYVLQMPVPLKG